MMNDFYHAGCAKGHACRKAHNTSSEATQLGRAGRHNYEQLPSWPSICQPIKLGDDYHMSDKLLKVILYSLCFFFPLPYCLSFSFLCCGIFFFFLSFALPEFLPVVISHRHLSFHLSSLCSSLPPQKRSPKHPLHLKFDLEMSYDSWFYQAHHCPVSAMLNYWLLEVPVYIFKYH